VTRILVDTNVVLDVVLARQPHLDSSLVVWLACDSGGVEGFLAAHTVTTLHYIIRQILGPTQTLSALESLLRVFRIAAVDETTIRVALRSGGADFEDQVAAAAANQAKCDWIVTRDPKGFRRSEVPATSPPEFVANLSSGR